MKKSDSEYNELEERGVKRRAQESFNFMIMIGLAIFLFLILSGIILQDTESAINLRSLTRMRSINEKISRAVYRSYMNGPGSEENITLEQVEENYTILIRPGNTIITHDLGSNTNPTRAYQVFSTNVTYGRVLIKNQEGWINVTQT